METAHSRRAAIVTGGASGIGKAIAVRLAREGYGVFIADLDGERAHECAEDLTRRGARAAASAVDVTDREPVRRMVAAAAEFGGIELLVNNAGIVMDGPLLTLPEEVWDRTLAVNLKGAFLCTQAVATLMVAGKVKGRIVNISSVQGVSVWPSVPHAPYEVSKAGLIMLTRQSAFELAPHGIQVNCAAPGPVDSNLSPIAYRWVALPTRRRWRRWYPFWPVPTLRTSPESPCLLTVAG